MRFFVFAFLFFVSLVFFPSQQLIAQEVIEVPKIEVKGKKATEEPESENKEQVVDKKDVPATLDSLQRVLRTEPEFVVREQGGAGQASSISVRGSDPHSTIIAIEGIPLNSPFLGSADLSSLGIFPLEGLFLDTEPVSISPIGGFLDAKVISPCKEKGFKGEVMLGSFSTSRLKLREGICQEKMNTLVSFGLFSTAGDFDYIDRNGKERTRNHNAVKALEGVWKGEFFLGKQKLETFVEAFADFKELPGPEQFESSTATGQNTRLICSFRYKRDSVFQKDDKAFAHAYIKLLRFEFDDSKPPMGPPQYADLLSVEANGEGALEERWGGFRLRLIASGSHTEGFVERKQQEARRPKRESAMGEIRLSFKKAWFSIAMRLQTPYVSDFGFFLVPYGKLSLKPHRLINLSFSISRAFRPPTFEELYYDVGFVQGNPNLRPEVAWQWDGTIKFGTKKNFVKVSYFEKRVSNLILFLPVSAFFTRAENSFRAFIRGVEIATSLKIKFFRANLSYAYMDATYIGGITMPARPRHRAGGTIELAFSRARFGLRGLFQSSFYLDRYESLKEEGRFMLDLFTEIKATKHLLFAFEVHNILDKRDAVDALQYPLPGRAFYASLGFSL